MRRSIAAARSYSINCSQIAQASASKGSGRRPERSHGRPRTERPISGSRAKRRTNAVRSSSTPSAKRIRSMPYLAASALAARAPKHDLAGSRLGDAHDDRDVVVVEQALEHAATAAQHAVGASPARQAKRAGRRDPSRSSTAALSVGDSAIARAAEQVHVHAAASGCRRSAAARRAPATRPRTATATHAGDQRRLRWRRWTSPTTAAPATKPPAATAAACTAGIIVPERSGTSAPRAACVPNSRGGPLSTGSASSSSTSTDTLTLASCGGAGCWGSLTRRSVEGAPDRC